MRRALMLMVVAGTFVAGLGCKQIAGKCDCTNDPSDAQLPVPGNPYPTIGAPVPSGTTMGAPATPAIPPAAADKLPALPTGK